MGRAIQSLLESQAGGAHSPPSPLSEVPHQDKTGKLS